jgi:hypothetical protein
MRSGNTTPEAGPSKTSNAPAWRYSLMASRFGRVALAPTFAALVVAGCGGSQAPIGAPSTAAASWQRGSDSTAAELLTAARVKLTLSGNCKFHPLDVTYAFHTTGVAKGPVGGTFSAHGKATITQEYGWTFDESFTIKSGSQRITGTISSMGSGSGGPVAGCHPPAIIGPFSVSYSTNSASGQATVDAIKPYKFRESLTGVI